MTAPVTRLIWVGLGGLWCATHALGASAYLTTAVQVYEAQCLRMQIRSEIGPQEARYVSNGTCRMMTAQQRQPIDSTFLDTAGAQEAYRFSWAAVASYNPTTKTTREEVTVQSRRADGPVSKTRPNGRFTFETICNADPWLALTTINCAKPKLTFTGNLPSTWDDAYVEDDLAAASKLLAQRGTPFTVTMLDAQLRQGLRNAQRQFEQRQAALARIGNQTYTPTTSTDRAGPATTSVGMVSAAQKLQAALDAQRAQQGLQGGAASESRPNPNDGGVGKGGGNAGAGSAIARSAPTASPAITLSTPQATATPTPPRLPDPADLTKAAGQLRVPGTSPSIDPRTTVDQRQSTLQRPGASTSATPVGGAGGSAPPPTSASAAPPVLGAPRIVAPEPAQRAQQGQLVTQALPAPGSDAAGTAEVEFAWQSPLPGQPERSPPAAVRWSLSMQQLARGTLVPVSSGPTATGRWTVRVRAAAVVPGAPAGAWSTPVTFDFMAIPVEQAAAGAGTAAAGQRQVRAQTSTPTTAAAKGLTRRSDDLERRGLNPQPLPPKEGSAPRSVFER